MIQFPGSISLEIQVKKVPQMFCENVVLEAYRDLKMRETDFWKPMVRAKWVVH